MRAQAVDIFMMLLAFARVARVDPEVQPARDARPAGAPIRLDLDSRGR